MPQFFPLGKVLPYCVFVLVCGDGSRCHLYVLGGVCPVFFSDDKVVDPVSI